jgi:hypothetical protein
MIQDKDKVNKIVEEEFSIPLDENTDNEDNFSIPLDTEEDTDFSIPLEEEATPMSMPENEIGGWENLFNTVTNTLKQLPEIPLKMYSGYAATAYTGINGLDYIAEKIGVSRENRVAVKNHLAASFAIGTNPVLASIMAKIGTTVELNGGGNIANPLINALSASDEMSNKIGETLGQEETQGIIESIEKDGFFSPQTLSAIVATPVSFVPSITASILGGPVGLVAYMTGDIVEGSIEAKQAVEKLINPSDERSLKEVYASSDSELAVSTTMGIVAGQLERYGLKRLSKFLEKKSIGGNFYKKVGAFLSLSGTEGAVEVASFTAESYASNFAASKYNEKGEELSLNDRFEEAARLTVDQVFSEEGAETFLQGFFGSAVAGGVGRGSKKILSNIIENKKKAMDSASEATDNATNSILEEIENKEGEGIEDKDFTTGNAKVDALINETTEDLTFEAEAKKALLNTESKDETTEEKPVLEELELSNDTTLNEDSNTSISKETEQEPISSKPDETDTEESQSSNVSTTQQLQSLTEESQASEETEQDKKSAKSLKIKEDFLQNAAKVFSDKGFSNEKVIDYFINKVNTSSKKKLISPAEAKIVKRIVSESNNNKKKIQEKYAKVFDSIVNSTAFKQAFSVEGASWNKIKSFLKNPKNAYLLSEDMLNDFAVKAQEIATMTSKEANKKEDGKTKVTLAKELLVNLDNEYRKAILDKKLNIMLESNDEGLYEEDNLTTAEVAETVILKSEKARIAATQKQREQKAYETYNKAVKGRISTESNKAVSSFISKAVKIDHTKLDKAELRRLIKGMKDYLDLGIISSDYASALASSEAKLALEKLKTIPKKFLDVMETAANVTIPQKLRQGMGKMFRSVEMGISFGHLLTDMASGHRESAAKFFSVFINQMSEAEKQTRIVKRNMLNKIVSYLAKNKIEQSEARLTVLASTIITTNFDTLTEENRLLSKKEITSNIERLKRSIEASRKALDNNSLNHKVKEDNVEADEQNILKIESVWNKIKDKDGDPVSNFIEDFFTDSMLGLRAIITSYASENMESLELNATAYHKSEFIRLNNYFPLVAMAKIKPDGTEGDFYKMKDDFEKSFEELMSGKEFDYASRYLKGKQASAAMTREDFVDNIIYDFDILNITDKLVGHIEFDLKATGEIKKISKLVNDKEFEELVGATNLRLIRRKLSDALKTHRGPNNYMGRAMRTVKYLVDAEALGRMANVKQYVTQTVAPFITTMITVNPKNATQALNLISTGKVGDEWFEKHAPAVGGRDVLWERFGKFFHNEKFSFDKAMDFMESNSIGLKALKSADLASTRITFLAAFLEAGGDINNPTEDSISKGETTAMMIQNNSSALFSARMFNPNLSENKGMHFALLAMAYRLKSFTIAQSVGFFSSMRHFSTNNDVKKFMAGVYAGTMVFSLASDFITNSFKYGGIYALDKMGDLSNVLGQELPDWMKVEFDDYNFNNLVLGIDDEDELEDYAERGLRSLIQPSIDLFLGVMPRGIETAFQFGIEDLNKSFTEKFLDRKYDPKKDKMTFKPVGEENTMIKMLGGLGDPLKTMKDYISSMAEYTFDIIDPDKEAEMSSELYFSQAKLFNLIKFYDAAFILKIIGEQARQEEIESKRKSKSGTNLGGTINKSLGKKDLNQNLDK